MGQWVVDGADVAVIHTGTHRTWRPGTDCLCVPGADQTQIATSSCNFLTRQRPKGAERPGWSHYLHQLFPGESHPESLAIKVSPAQPAHMKLASTH